MLKILRSLLETQTPQTPVSPEALGAHSPPHSPQFDEELVTKRRSELLSGKGQRNLRRCLSKADKPHEGPIPPINHSKSRVSITELAVEEKVKEPSYSSWFFEKLNKRTQMISLHIMLKCLPDDAAKRDVLTTVAAKEFGEDVALLKMLYEELIKNGKYAKEANYMATRYVMGKLIGTGATGKVLDAVEKQSGMKVAVKVLPNTKSGMRHFKAERDVLLLLDHPNIIELYDSCESVDNEYIVLELCKGGELFEQITSDKYTITEERAARLVTIMIEAVQYMHSRNVVHRDLKPENFLFKTPEEKSDMVLIDFGTAKVVKPRTAYSEIAGTPYFVAPEILRTRRRSGKTLKAADVWSLGVVCYIMMTGRPPFPGKTNPEIFQNIVKSKPRPFPKTVPKNFQDFCLKLLTKHPRERITLKDAKEHPWLVAGRGRKQDTKLCKEVVQMLRQFTTQTKLKRAVIKVLMQCISPTETAKLKYQFDLLDTDQNGVLGVDELKLLLMTCDITEGRASEEAKSIVLSADGDGSGEITFEQFTEIWQRKVLSTNDDYIRTLFSVFDSNGDGRIDEAELKMVVQGNDTEVRDCIKEVDKSGDGTINFEEFRAAMKETSNHQRGNLLTQDSSVGMGEIKEFEVRKSLTLYNDGDDILHV